MEPSEWSKVNKDNVLFLVIGSLCGFIAGYMIQERMAKVQPQPRIHGEAQAEAGGQATNPGTAPATQGGGMPNSGGPPNAMVQQLARRVAENPNDAEAIRQLANMNFDISNWSRARELYQRYLTLQPGDSDVLTDLGICYRAEGLFPEAIQAFDQALEGKADHWLAFYNKTIVLGIDLGDYAAAGAALEQLRKLRPGDLEVKRLSDEIDRRRQAAG
ncbi:MAG: tetratricopeptide repeat protein [Deltaproteobacteria bacterium]|nr:tetratricopeptide repeat protein [Deltaproteobacteria bacterium]